MKLSDKGYEKLNKHAYIQSEDPFIFAELDKDGVCEVELESDDFTGAVILTVEEARRCHDCCCIAYQFVVDEAKPKHDELIDKLEKFVLDEMAKQAEKGNEVE